MIFIIYCLLTATVVVPVDVVVVAAAVVSAAAAAAENFAMTASNIFAQYTRFCFFV